MAWTIVGTSATVEATATPLTLTEPAGVADGDLLVATISSRSTATTAPTATGWTAVASQNNNNTLTTGSAIGSGAMLYRVRSGTPTLAFTLPAGISVAQGRITAYRGQASIPASIVPTANAIGVGTQNSTYATARGATNATTTPAATTTFVGQQNALGTHGCTQYFLTFDTSAVPAGATSAILSVNVAVAATSLGDAYEVRQVSSAANKIAGGSLSAQTPVLGSLVLPSGVGRLFIPLDITSMARASGTILCIHSQKERIGTASTSTEAPTLSSLAAAADLQPFMAFVDGVTAGTAAAGTAVSVAGLTTQDDDLIVAMTAGGQEATWASFNNVGEAATWSIADKVNITLSGSDKTATSSAASAGVRSITKHTLGTTGKFYAELVLNSISGADPRAGLKAASAALAGTTSAVHVVPSNGDIRLDSTTLGNVGGGGFATGTVICIACDMAAKRIWFRKGSGLWNNDATADPATGANGLDISSLSNEDYHLWMGSTSSTSCNTIIRTVPADFTQTVPLNFNAWSGVGPLTASGSTNTTTAPSSTAWIKRAETVTTSGADTSLGVFDAVRTAAGATGNLTVTASISAGHVVIAGAFKMLPVSGGITVNATGVAAGTALGTTTVDAIAPVGFEAVGVTAGSALGTVIAAGKTNTSTVASGAAAITAPGVVTVDTVWNVTATSTGRTAGTVLGTATVSATASVNTTPTGQTAATALGNVSVAAGGAVSVIPAGVTASALTGTAAVSVQQYVSSTPTGVAATALSGTAGVAGAAVVAASGQAAATALSPVTVNTVQVVSVTPAGVSASTALGGVSIAVGGGISITPSSLAAVAIEGTATVAAQQQVSTSASGVTATALSGTASVSIRTSTAAAGVAAAAVVGTPTITAKQAVTTAATGVSAGTLLGGVSVAAGGSVSVAAAGQAAPAATGTVAVTAKRFISVAASGVAAATADGVAVATGKTVAQGVGQFTTALVGTVTVTTGAAVSGVGVWTGSAWADKPVKVWTGTAWMQKPVKVWNGSAWI